MPTKPTERSKVYMELVQIMRDGMERGVRDFGLFVGENAGFIVFEGNEIELTLLCQQLYPYLQLRVKQFIGLDVYEETAKALKEMEA